MTANPPYIPPGMLPVEPEVRDHDPEVALYGGGDDGLAVARAVVSTASALLRPGGLLVMEHADVQGPTARALVAGSAWGDVRTGHGPGRAPAGAARPPGDTLDAVSVRFDCGDPTPRVDGLARASVALSAGELVVAPDRHRLRPRRDAFSPVAVARLLAAKGRGRSMPPPVLVPHERTLDGIAIRIPAVVRDLTRAFWPGALTVVCHAQPTLDWDLGDARGTVAVRMPLHSVALELLERTGPLAVSSANVSGRPAATTCDEAEEQLGDLVSVFLDAGTSPGGVASTIIDATGEVPRLLRLGALSLEQLREVAADLAVPDEVGRTR